MGIARENERKLIQVREEILPWENLKIGSTHNWFDLLFGYSIDSKIFVPKSTAKNVQTEGSQFSSWKSRKDPGTRIPHLCAFRGSINFISDFNVN